MVERSVRSLSGGERRRVALALAFGFADLVRMRGNLHCNVMILDEVCYACTALPRGELLGHVVHCFVMRWSSIRYVLCVVPVDMAYCF